MKVISRSGRRNKLHLARCWLRRHGQTPIAGGGSILSDGSVSIPLVGGAIAHIAFATVTQTFCRLVATTSAPAASAAKTNSVGHGNANGDGNGDGHSRPSRSEIFDALATLLDVLTEAESASVSHEGQLPIAAQ